MDAFVAAAIHDAKNALNALGVWLEEASRECPAPALHRARAIATRLSAQFVELLALYRAGEGSLRLAIDDQVIEDFIADIRATVAGECPPGIEFPAARLEEAPACWAFDAYLVHFILVDALRNGLRHARHRVDLAVAGAPGGGLLFTVRDDGPGYPTEVLAGGLGEMAPGSSGLGLAFARLVASRHVTPAGRRGHVELSNDPSTGGAVFRLFLP